MNNVFYRISSGNFGGYSVNYNVSSPTRYQGKCSTCGKEKSSIDYDHPHIEMDRAPKKWPDIINFHFGLIHCVSDKVADDMKSAGITGYKLHPVEIQNVPTNTQPPFRYWILEPLGCAKLVAQSGADIQSFFCPECGDYDGHALYQKNDELKLVTVSCDDMDWAKEKFQLNGARCSERVIDLACQKGWTNFKFQISRPKLGEVTVPHEHSDWRERVEREFDLINLELYGMHDWSIPETPPVVSASRDPFTPIFPKFDLDVNTVKLFSIRHTELFNKRFASVYGNWHRSDLDKCPKCKTTVYGWRFDSFISDAYKPEKEWPDLLRYEETCHVVVSDKVLNDMRENGIGDFNVHPLVIHKLPKKIKDTAKYWLIEPTAKVEYIPVITEDFFPFSCPVCGRLTNGDFKKETGHYCQPYYVLREETYAGQDWAIASIGGESREVLCSAKIVDLAARCGWTNFEFRVPRTGRYGQFIIHHQHPEWRDFLHRELRGEKIKLPPTPTSPDESMETTSNHPFDNLSVFDGTAWQGHVNLPSTLGECDMVVTEAKSAVYDVVDNADYLPAKGQRKLYDCFVANQTPLLPLLHEAIRKKFIDALSVVVEKREPAVIEDYAVEDENGNLVIDEEDFTAWLTSGNETHAQEAFREISIHSTAVAATTTFDELKQWLDNPFLDIGDASVRGKGQVSLSFDVKDTENQLTIKILCNPQRNSVSIGEISVDVAG